MSRTPKQQAALTELQKRYGDTTDARSAEWVRVATYYNDRRGIGTPGWGELEIDVKRSWRDEYRELLRPAAPDKGVTEDKGADVQARGEVAEWLALGGIEEKKLTDYIPPEDMVLGPKMVNVPCVAATCERSWSTTDDRVKVYKAMMSGGWWADKDSNYWCPDHRDNSVSYLAWIREGNEHQPFEGGGVREGHGDRPRFELLVPLGVPFEDQLLTRCAVHMAKGARKYEDRNWESFSDEAALERAKASAFRHLMQWLTDDNGEDHAAAVVFNLMAAEHVRAKLT